MYMITRFRMTLILVLIALVIVVITSYMLWRASRLPSL
jgi:hypothetical protein